MPSRFQTGTDRWVSLVAWALQRLLNDEYDLALDSEGNPERLEIDPYYGALSLEGFEEDLRTNFPAQSVEKLLALRNDRTPEDVRAALREFPFVEVYLGKMEFEKLLRKEWEEIFTSLDWAVRRFSDDILHDTIASRIGIGSSRSARLETGMQLRRPDALPQWTSRYVVREMIALLPAAVKRLRAFQVTPVTSAVPATVAQYAREATRCYLYGFLSAALILCRSCIESGIEERLRQEGFRKQLDAIGYNKVQAMLDLALSSGVLDDLTFAMANGIRKSANKAAHGTTPGPQECQEKLEQTRALLRHLYE